jgi:hypothetical protein
MKIDWGRVPEDTLVKFCLEDGNYSIEFFKRYNAKKDLVISNNWKNSSLDSPTIQVDAKYFSLVMPDDIEKYTIKEEPKYVCPVCGEEVYQNAHDRIELPSGSSYSFVQCECGVLLTKINGHFGKKVE